MSAHIVHSIDVSPMLQLSFWQIRCVKVFLSMTSRARAELLSALSFVAIETEVFIWIIEWDQ